MLVLIGKLHLLSGFVVILLKWRAALLLKIAKISVFVVTSEACRVWFL